MNDTAIDYNTIASTNEILMGDLSLAQCSLCGALVILRASGPPTAQITHTGWHRSESGRMHEAASRYEALRARSVGHGM